MDWIEWISIFIHKFEVEQHGIIPVYKYQFLFYFRLVLQINFEAIVQNTQKLVLLLWSSNSVTIVMVGDFVQKNLNDFNVWICGIAFMQFLHSFDGNHEINI